MSGEGQGRQKRRLLSPAYGVVSVALIGLHPFLPASSDDLELAVICAGAAACVAYGRRAVPPGARYPWSMLLVALAVLVAGNAVSLVPGPSAVTAGWLLDAVGNLLVLGAALALIIKCGSHDLGGLIDAAVIALAGGSLLWALLPHRLSSDESFPAQLNLFVVVGALAGVLGALLRLLRTTTEAISALRWLLYAIGLAIGGNVVLAFAEEDSALRSVATMTFLATFTAIGLFGLDATAPRLAQPQAMRRERLSTARLVFLCAAIAVVPVAIGARNLSAGDSDGLVLAVQGIAVAALVMVRIGQLSAERTRAEQALEHAATHDALTHLPNRRQFLNRLRDVLEQGTGGVVLFCDLDRFKEINDRFGHDAGDQLLIEVSRRLRACIDPPGMVSRFGGDEFVVLLIGATRVQGQGVAARIAAALREPFEQTGGAGIDVSIGIADATDGHDPEQLVSRADQIMYRAKAARASDRATRPARPARPAVQDAYRAHGPAAARTKEPAGEPGGSRRPAQ